MRLESKEECKEDYLKLIGGRLRKWEKARRRNHYDQIKSKIDIYFLYAGRYKIINT